MTSGYYDEIARRLAAVRERMEKAADRAGRKADEVTLVGVTKTQSAAAVRALLQAGLCDIGENRVQELLQKEGELVDLPHKTHLIGHLQRNKAKMLPGHVDMVQSVDGEAIVAALEKAYAGSGQPLDVLIEVNIGGEASKSGVAPEDLAKLAERVWQSGALRLRGLMAIPPFVEGEEVRRYFARMRQLFVDIQGQKRDNDIVNVLSMGMSSDFEYAILEGATMIRVGTELFGPRPTT